MNIRKSWHGLFPDTQFNLHYAATATCWPSQREFCLLSPSIKQAMHQALDTLILGLFQEQDEGKYTPR